MSIKKAFTLAETLITLTILGVLAAIVIPQFVGNFTSNAFQKSHAIFNSPNKSSFYEALKQMNVKDDLVGHANTVEFVDKFQKYMKVIKRCDGNATGGNGIAYSKCFPTSLTSDNPDDPVLDINTLSNTQDAFTAAPFDADLVALGLNNGYTMILGYDSSCSLDPFDSGANPWSCVSFIYDLNGFKKPNKKGDNKDMNGNTSFIFSDPYFPNKLPSGLAYSDVPAGMSIGTDMYWAPDSTYSPKVLFPVTATFEESSAFTAYGCTKPDSTWICPNLWVSAKDYCSSIGGHLATHEEYNEIFDYLVSEGGFDVTSAGYTSRWTVDATCDAKYSCNKLVGSAADAYPHLKTYTSSTNAYATSPFYCVK